MKEIIEICGGKKSTAYRIIKKFIERNLVEKRGGLLLWIGSDVGKIRKCIRCLRYPRYRTVEHRYIYLQFYFRDPTVDELRKKVVEWYNIKREAVKDVEAFKSMLFEASREEPWDEPSSKDIEMAEKWAALLQHALLRIGNYRCKKPLDTLPLLRKILMWGYKDIFYFVRPLWDDERVSPEMIEWKERRNDIYTKKGVPTIDERVAEVIRLKLIEKKIFTPDYFIREKKLKDKFIPAEKDIDRFRPVRG